MWRSLPISDYPFVVACLPAAPVSLLGILPVDKPATTRARLMLSESKAKMRVFCARSMHVAVAALTRPFGTNAAAPGAADPDIVFEPMGALQARLAAGETADVLILAAPMIDALIASGAVIAASRAAVARAPIGIAARDGAAVPDISTADGFVAALKSARAVALSDPAVGGSAGVYLRDLFARLGIADIIAAKTVTQKSGVAAADAVGRGDADLALTFIPELLQGKGVRILGPLPLPCGHATAYVAGVSAHSGLQEPACAFIAALTAPGAAGVWTAAGFEVGQGP
jgi:molybdate transport system substrate-binding protein